MAFKCKLPKTLTWPVGAEVVTAGLGDAPHVAECRLWFSDSPVWRASEFQKTLRQVRPYAVLVAEYRPANRGYSCSNAVAAAGFYDSKWQIRVNPVPRVWRAAVRTLLRERGLPAVAQWLRSFQGAGWQDRCRRLELVFAPAGRTLTREVFDGV